MVSSRQQQPQPGRRELEALHHGVVVEISRHLRDAGNVSGPATPDGAGRARHPDIDKSIQAITSARSVIGALSAKMKTYEKIIFGLNKTIAEHRSSEELSYKRAKQAEARAQDAEAQIRRLELREKTAMDHLDRAMKAVDKSFAFSPRLDQNARARA